MPLDPNDRMNPNMPVQLFLDDPPRKDSPPPRRKRKPVETVIEDAGPMGAEDNFHYQSPVKEYFCNGKKMVVQEGTLADGRFARIPQNVFTNRKKRNVASSVCDLQAHFLRSVANIVVHRFSNYGRTDPEGSFVDKIFQGSVPFKFCTIREVRNYIDTSMYGIRDQLRPQLIESVCFAIVNRLEESLFEVNVDIFQTKGFYNRRIRTPNPKPLCDLRPQLCKALRDLQEMTVPLRVLRNLMRASTSLTIRYSTIEAGEDEDDVKCPEGWDPIFPTPRDYCGDLLAWTNPIHNEFNHMQFHAMIGDFI